MNRMTIYNWKNGKSIPNLKTLHKAKEAGVDISPFKKIAVSWLLGQIEKINEL